MLEDLAIGLHEPEEYDRADGPPPFVSGSFPRAKPRTTALLMTRRAFQDFVNPCVLAGCFCGGAGIETYYLRPRRFEMYIGGGVLLLIVIILLIIFLL